MFFKIPRLLCGMIRDMQEIVWGPRVLWKELAYLLCVMFFAFPHSMASCVKHRWHHVLYPVLDARQPHRNFHCEYSRPECWRSVHPGDVMFHQSGPGLDYAVCHDKTEETQASLNGRRLFTGEAVEQARKITYYLFSSFDPSHSNMTLKMLCIHFSF